MERFRQWMVGRYGNDSLGIGIVVLYFIVVVINWFLHLPVLIMLSYALVLLWGFRVFSRNISKRYQENQKFLKVMKPFIAMGNLGRRMFVERKTSRFFKCPQCKQVIRVPKGKGRIMITCPKCKKEFKKRT